MITRLDGGVGRLLQTLKDLGTDENTVVFFSSDNGPHREGGANPEFFDSNGPLRGIKRDLYEGGIRVPLVARWPGRIKPGVITDHVSAFWDFLPTCAELAVAPPPSGVVPAGGGWATCDGISMLPTLLGQSVRQRKHAFLYWEFHEDGSIQAVRMDRWKAVRPVGKPMELYDLQTDLRETNNVAGGHPEIVSKIEECLTKARTESEFWPLKGGNS
jgi:arylsulfatase A-like enzyme